MNGTIYCIMIPFIDKTYYWNGSYDRSVIQWTESKFRARQLKTRKGAEKALERLIKTMPKAFISEV